MLKKETVSLSLKNAILCLRFALVHFILTNHFAAIASSLNTATQYLRDECCNAVVVALGATTSPDIIGRIQKSHHGLVINEATSVFLAKFIVTPFTGANHLIFLSLLPLRL